MSQHPTLQRSRSAPHTVTSFAESERKPLARTVSHEHVHRRAQQKQHQRHQLKPVSTGWPMSPLEEEDPFNLVTFFPTGFGKRASGWQSWLRRHEAITEEDEMEGDGGIEAGVDSPTIFLPEEDKHEAVDRPDWLGSDKEDILLSPYRLDEAVNEESLFEHFRNRRARWDMSEYEY